MYRSFIRYRITIYFKPVYLEDHLYQFCWYELKISPDFNDFRLWQQWRGGVVGRRSTRWSFTGRQRRASRTATSTMTSPASCPPLLSSVSPTTNYSQKISKEMIICICMIDILIVLICLIITIILIMGLESVSASEDVIGTS